VSVCLSASISLEPLDQSAQNFVCRTPVGVALSSFGGIAIRYVLPVLWPYGDAWSGVAILGRSLMSMNALFGVFQFDLYGKFVSLLTFQFQLIEIIIPEWTWSLVLVSVAG